METTSDGQHKKALHDLVHYPTGDILIHSFEELWHNLYFYLFLLLFYRL